MTAHPVRLRSEDSTDLRDLLHTTCCIDPDTLLCGRDGTGMEWNTGRALCVTCEVAEQRDACPKFGRCAHADGAEN